MVDGEEGGGEYVIVEEEGESGGKGGKERWAGEDDGVGVLNAAECGRQHELDVRGRVGRRVDEEAGVDAKASGEGGAEAETEGVGEGGVLVWAGGDGSGSGEGRG